MLRKVVQFVFIRVFAESSISFIGNLYFLCFQSMASLFFYLVDFVFCYCIPTDHDSSLLMNSWQFLSILFEGRKLFQIDLGDLGLRLAQNIIDDAQKLHFLSVLELVFIRT